jgi:hypothetical protein
MVVVGGGDVDVRAVDVRAVESALVCGAAEHEANTTTTRTPDPTMRRRSRFLQCTGAS